MTNDHGWIMLLWHWGWTCDVVVVKETTRSLLYNVAKQHHTEKLNIHKLIGTF